MNDRYKILLEKNNMDAKEYSELLAEKYSINKYQSNKWIAGKLVPPVDVLINIASDLKTNIAYILGMTELDYACEKYERCSPLTKIMLSHKITLTKLSEETNLSPITIRNFSMDGRTVISTAKTLASHFDVSVDYILGLTNYMNWEDKLKENPLVNIKNGEAVHVYYHVPSEGKQYLAAIKTLNGKHLIFSNGQIVPITDESLEQCEVRLLEEKKGGKFK